MTLLQNAPITQLGFSAYDKVNDRDGLDVAVTPAGKSPAKEKARDKARV